MMSPLLPQFTVHACGRQSFDVRPSAGWIYSQHIYMLLVLTLIPGTIRSSMFGLVLLYSDSSSQPLEIKSHAASCRFGCISRVQDDLKKQKKPHTFCTARSITECNAQTLTARPLARCFYYDVRICLRSYRVANSLHRQTVQNRAFDAVIQQICQWFMFAAPRSGLFRNISCSWIKRALIKELKIEFIYRRMCFHVKII